VRSLGIDVGVGKGLDIVLMDERRTPSVVLSRAGLDDVERLVREYTPSIVAIDSPPTWARGGKSRVTENELARLNIHAFRTPSVEHAEHPRFDWMRKGMEVFALVGKLGYPVAAGKPYRGRAIEVFPHATAAVLAGCLPPRGERKRQWRERVLRLQKVRTEELSTIDRLDAALAALTGLLVLDGHESHLGDPAEGVIVIPSSALAPIYRPGTIARDDPATLFAWCVCGEPGCNRQVPAGTEFAPGHDAKRKYRLWRQVRDGDSSRDELRRRGWELPPETTT
jgi:predicted nuclease with RNAse H fold